MADLPVYFESLMRFYTHGPRQSTPGRAFSPGFAVLYPNFDGRWHKSFCACPGEERDPALKPMSFDDFRGALEDLPRRAAVQVSGGAPLKARWMRRALALAAGKRRVSLFTGGEGILPDDASLVMSRAAEGLVEPGIWEVGLTLFGDEASHDELVGHPGTYAAAIEELAEIRRQRKALGGRYPLVNLRFVLSPDTLKGFTEAWSLARELRIDQFTVVLEDRGPWFEPSAEKGVSTMEKAPPKFPRGFARDAAARLATVQDSAQAKFMPRVRVTQGADSPAEVRAYFAGERDPSKYECPLPWFWVMVDPRGDAYLCPRYKLGNLHDEGMGELWNGGRARTFRKALRMRGSFPACAGCPGLRFKKDAHRKTKADGHRA